MAKTTKILVVDDEEPISEILAFHLQKEGYQVASALSGPEALSEFRSWHPDIVILDLMLPGMDGLEVCREIRKESGVPILMLTAKAEEVDKVVGLEVGADDYVTKPFSPREVIARVRALLRRLQGFGPPPSVMDFGDLAIDAERYAVWRGEAKVDLTHREFALLHFLAAHPGRIFSRQAILDEVWGYDFSGDARTVDVTVRRVREKVEPHPKEPQRIKTRRGVGYYFDGDGA